MIDLHIHSTHSDGTYSVLDILKEAKKRNLEIISITDHDTVDAHFELENINIKQYYTGRVISGCEFKAVFTNHKLPIEILGYGFDINIVKQFLEEHANKDIQNKYLSHLKSVGEKIGLIFDKNLMTDYSKREYASAVFEKELSKYKENEQILKDNNVNIEVNFYRDAQANENSIFYIDETKFSLDAKEIIDLIHRAGGIAFLAHPLIYNVNDKLEVIEEFINTYKEIDGLECYYSLFSEDETAELVKLCNKYNLFTSGGTDFHGLNKPDIELGIGKGNLNINKEIVSNWINKGR